MHADDVLARIAQLAESYLLHGVPAKEFADNVCILLSEAGLLGD